MNDTNEIEGPVKSKETEKYWAERKVERRLRVQARQLRKQKRRTLKKAQWKSK